MPRGSSVEAGRGDAAGATWIVQSEVISNASQVLLDEPTTGLDAATALDVMAHVRDGVARTRKNSVVCCVHGPSADVFGKCDNVLLLGVDGRPAYAGRAGDAAGFLRGAVGRAPRKNEAAPDFLLDVVTTGSEAGALADAFQMSTDGQRLLASVESASRVPRAPPPPRDDDQGTTARQVAVLVERSLTQFGRSGAIWKTSLLKMGWIGLLYASTFADQRRTATGAANLESCYYFSLMFGILGNLRALVTLFDERALRVWPSGLALCDVLEDHDACPVRGALAADAAAREPVPTPRGGVDDGRS